MGRFSILMKLHWAQQADFRHYAEYSVLLGENITKNREQSISLSLSMREGGDEETGFGSE